MPKVPFSFAVGKKVLAPGTYAVTSNGDGGLLTSGFNSGVLVLTRCAESGYTEARVPLDSC